MQCTKGQKRHEVRRAGHDVAFTSSHTSFGFLGRVGVTTKLFDEAAAVIFDNGTLNATQIRGRDARAVVRLWWSRGGGFAEIVLRQRSDGRRT